MSDNWNITPESVKKIFQQRTAEWRHGMLLVGVLTFGSGIE
jgi:hypothetical protein